MNDIFRDIKVVVLDLDDTLYLEKDFSFSGFDFLEEKYQIQNFSKTAKYLYLNKAKSNVLDNTFQELNIPLTPQLLSSMIKDFREHFPKISLCDDSVVFLDFLRRNNFKSAIITDGFSSSQANKIVSLNLNKLIDHIIITDALDSTGSKFFWKPHPLAYIKIEQYFNVPPSQCIYIGDNLNKDFITPIDRGWKHLLISREGSVHQAQHKNYNCLKINSFLELV